MFIIFNYHYWYNWAIRKEFLKTRGAMHTLGVTTPSCDSSSHILWRGFRGVSLTPFPEDLRKLLHPAVFLFMNTPQLNSLLNWSQVFSGIFERCWFIQTSHRQNWVSCCYMLSLRLVYASLPQHTAGFICRMTVMHSAADILCGRAEFVPQNSTAGDFLKRGYQKNGCFFFEGKSHL